MTIFTYLHFCLKEQTGALLSVPRQANIQKRGRWHEGAKTSRAKGLKTGRNAAGDTWRTA